MVAPLGVGSAQNATTATLDSEGFLAYAHGGSAAKVLEHASLNDWQFFYIIYCALRIRFSTRASPRT